MWILVSFLATPLLIQLHANNQREAEAGVKGVLAPTSHTRDPDGAPGSGLPSALAIVAIWIVSSRWKIFLSLSVPLSLPLSLSNLTSK